MIPMRSDFPFTELFVKQNLKDSVKESETFSILPDIAQRGNLLHKFGANNDKFAAKGASSNANCI